jgi:hypothetical protein
VRQKYVQNFLENAANATATAMAARFTSDIDQQKVPTKQTLDAADQRINLYVAGSFARRQMCFASFAMQTLDQSVGAELLVFASEPDSGFHEVPPADV